MLGRLLLTENNLPGVTLLLKESLILFSEINNKEGRARALILMGELMSKQGKYAEAQALLEESLAIMRDLKLAAGIASSLEGLTIREVEVLRLVANGLTNAQIALQLVISTRTVNAHMRSIYNKLEISSRTAATRFAIDHHLVL